MAIEDIVIYFAYRGWTSRIARNLFKGSKDPVGEEIANQSEDLLNNPSNKRYIKLKKDNPLNVTKVNGLINEYVPKFSNVERSGTNCLIQILILLNKAISYDLYSQVQDDGVE